MSRRPPPTAGPVRWSIAAAAFLLAACGGRQSSLSPAGRDAERIAELFWWMAGGAASVWLIVMGIALYAVLQRKRQHSRTRTRLFIVGGGALFPTVVLTGLLLYGLGMMPALLDRGEEDGVRISVAGERWWWRVNYELPDGGKFELANELWLPVRRRIPLWLTSPDVIHAFWVPALGGKTDMIPGRVNRMALEPTRTGVFRGVCAEYCGTSHAEMAFHVVVAEPEEFEAWARAQQQPAERPEGPVASRGAELFDSYGCGACHTIRGTDADGVIGPDLTHVGSRINLAAGVLENDVAGFARWVEHTREIKPGVNMPSFDMLPEGDLHAIAVFLEGLK